MRLKRAGYEGTAEAKLGLKRTVAVKAVEKQQLIAGFVAAGSFTTTSSLAAFSKDLTNWIGPTAPTEAIAVVLIGFPDLEPNGDENAGPDGPTANECIIRPAFCGISSSSTSGSELCQGSYLTQKNGICPTSHPTMVKQIQHCLDQGVTVSVPQAGTSVSAGTSQSWNPDPFTMDMKDYCISRCGGVESCVTWCGTELARQNGNFDAETKVCSLSMNNQTMATYICYQQYGYYQAPSFGSGQGSYRMSSYNGPNSNYDAVCCN